MKLLKKAKREDLKDVILNLVEKNDTLNLYKDGKFNTDPTYKGWKQT
jgi:hypothetical protein